MKLFYSNTFREIKKVATDFCTDLSNLKLEHQRHYLKEQFNPEKQKRLKEQMLANEQVELDMCVSDSLNLFIDQF